MEWRDRTMRTVDPSVCSKFYGQLIARPISFYSTHLFVYDVLVGKINEWFANMFDVGHILNL